MEGSAANAKAVSATYWINEKKNGKDTTRIGSVQVMVIASGVVVSLGDYMFKRDDLLLAMGVTQADINRLENK